MTNHWIIFVATLFATCGAYHNVIANDILDKGEGIVDSTAVRKVLLETLIDTAKLASKSPHTPLNEDLVQKFIEDQGKLGVKGNYNVSTNGCACVMKNCGCCAHVELKEIELDDTICANVSYLSEEIGLRVTLTVNKHVIINETVSVKNPPPICADIPDLKRLASVCIKFSDLDVTSSTFKGCIAIELRALYIAKVDIKLGCFNIPVPVSQEVSSETVGAQGHQLKVTTQPVQTDDRLYFKRQRKYGSP